jgi:hypothetical protein
VTRPGRRRRPFSLNNPKRNVAGWAGEAVLDFQAVAAAIREAAVIQEADTRVAVGAAAIRNKVVEVTLELEATVTHL